eukprot:TRINITY_DN6120_c0_g4_i1.p1 TRINITY_DN6120_c0_g4~~TRINITY_DN6120_c0_g4_i1.p1  ORF type:complete len:265 (-),score=46.56 TRINITY_DN6120_c0_g4_i1:134-901(-)
MSQAYCVKNTFVEYDDDDDEDADPPRIQRSQSWSGTVSSSMQSSDQTGSDCSSSGNSDIPKTRAEGTESGMMALEAQQLIPQERKGDGDIDAAALPGRHRHDDKRCIPCASMEVVGTCRDGSDCRFCHLSHADHKIQRPSKEIRLRCKRELKALMDRHQHSEQDKMVAIQHLLSQQTSYVRQYTYKLLGVSSDAVAALHATDHPALAPQSHGRVDSARSGYHMDSYSTQQASACKGSKGSGTQDPDGRGKGRLSF